MPSSISGTRSKRGVRNSKIAFPSQPEASSSVTSRTRAQEGFVGHGWLGDKGFAEDVDLWVRQAVDADGCTFGDLLRRLPGVYPSEVAASLRRQVISGHIPLLYGARLLSQS